MTMKSDELFKLIKEATLLSKESKYEDAHKLLNNAKELAIDSNRQELLAVIYATFGYILTSYRDFEEAKGILEQSLDLLEQFAVRDSFYNLWVAGVQRNLGYLFKIMGKHEDAKEKYQSALKVHEALFEKDPTSVIYLSQVVMTLKGLANLLKDMHKREDAANKFKRAHELEETLLKNAPDFEMYSPDITGVLINNPKYFIIYKIKIKVEFDIEKFLKNNHKLFTALGLFGALSIYLNSISNEPSEIFKLGIVSSLIIFIVISIKIFSKAFEFHSYNTILSLSIGNLKRIVFIIPFFCMSISILYHILINLNNPLIVLLQIFVFIFGVIILKWFNDVNEKIYLKVVESAIPNVFVFVLEFFFLSIPFIFLLNFPTNYSNFLTSIYLALLVSYCLLLPYFLFRFQNISQYIDSYHYYHFNWHFIKYSMSIIKSSIKRKK